MNKSDEDDEFEPIDMVVRVNSPEVSFAWTNEIADIGLDTDVSLIHFV